MHSFDLVDAAQTASKGLATGFWLEHGFYIFPACKANSQSNITENLTV